MPGVTLTKWRRTWAERLPGVPLEVAEVTEADQRAALDEGRVDMCFARLPLDSAGLHVIRLYDEVAVVVAPKDHPFAEREEVSLEDLSAETLVTGDAEASATERVAWGAGVAVMPHSIARSQSRSDLVFRPVTDAEPTTVVLAWRVDTPDELVQEFVGIVRGRTANSSRTAAERASRPAPAPEPRRERPAKAPRRGGGPQRGRGRRR